MTTTNQTDSSATSGEMPVGIPASAFVEEYGAGAYAYTLDQVIQARRLGAATSTTLKRMASCGTAHSFLTMPDEAKREFFARAVEDSVLLKQFEERFEFLHSTNKDADGWEWGVARVRISADGKIEYLWGASDHSDLDAAIAAAPVSQAATPSPGLDERALFEQCESGLKLARKLDGDYENPFVQSAWNGWQYRAALTQQAAPEAPASEQALSFNGMSIKVDPALPPGTMRLKSGRHSVTLIGIDRAATTASTEMTAEQARAALQAMPLEAVVGMVKGATTASASGSDSGDIVHEILGIFQSCGFEVREPSEPGLSNPFAVCGSLDSAAVLLETLLTETNACSHGGERFDWSRKGMVLNPEGFYVHYRKTDDILDEVAASIKSTFRPDDRLDPDYIAQCILSHKGCAPAPSRSVAPLDDAQLVAAMRPHLYEADGGYACDTAPEHVSAAGRAAMALAQQGAAQGSAGPQPEE